MDWKYLFDDRILSRGQDYYEQDLVILFKNRKHGFCARVQGNEIYTVNISISDDVVTDMYCSCPHAADGNNCKHMAAVLFYAENDAIQNDENKSSIDSNDSCTDFSIQKLIENTGSEDIKDFLIDILKKDPMLLQQFKLKTHCKISSDDLKIYEHQIDTICKSYTDKYGYISYYETRGFYNELTGFLQNTVIKVIDNTEYAGAVKLIKYLFIKLGKLSIDDSNGTLGGLAAHGITLLQSILKTCNQQVKKLLYEECKSLSMNDAVLDYLQDYITELIFSDFTEDEFLQDKLIFSENRANLFFHDKKDYSSKYSAESWVKYHIHVMKELKLPQEDIDNYCKKYLSLSGIREYYADECIQVKQYEEAVKILEDGKLADKEYPGLVHSYSEKLKEIYAKTNQRKKYIDELWHIVLEYNCGDLDTYKKLKTFYTADEWAEKREIIFNRKDIYGIDKLYLYDGLYDRLLKLALESQGLDYILKYEDLIKDLAPKEILKRYEVVIRKKAVYTSDRAVYREIADLLKRMKKYKGGNESVQTLIEEFRIEYRNRPAMMQELNKV